MATNLVYFPNINVLHVFKDDYSHSLEVPITFQVKGYHKGLPSLCALIASLYPQDKLRLATVGDNLESEAAGPSRQLRDKFSIHEDTTIVSEQSRSLSNEGTDKKFNRAMKAIEKKEKELWAAGIDLISSDSPDAGSTINAAGYASGLYEAMQTAYNNFMETGNKAEFKIAAERAISIAKDSPLKNHRGYKEILGYAGLGLLAVLSVATGGIAYAVAGALNYAINDQFFFSTKINTDSINLVEDLAEVVEEIFSEKP